MNPKLNQSEPLTILWLAPTSAIGEPKCHYDNLVQPTEIGNKQTNRQTREMHRLRQRCHQ